MVKDEFDEILVNENDENDCGGCVNDGDDCDFHDFVDCVVQIEDIAVVHLVDSCEQESWRV